MTRNQMIALVVLGVLVLAAGSAYAGSSVIDFDIEKFLNAIKQIESGGNPNAVNKKSGARGAYQFMPATWKDVWTRILKEPANADFNLAFDEQISRRAAKAYFEWIAAYLSKRGVYSMDNLAAAYNAGIGNVVKYKGIPPFDETKKYVAQMRKLMGV